MEFVPSIPFRKMEINGGGACPNLLNLQWQHGNMKISKVMREL